MIEWCIIKLVEEMIRVLILNTLIWGIVSGIVSSGIIYVLVFKIKPTVEVGNKIAKSYEDGKIIYRIKIINNYWI